jgi:hypothetical protein
VFAAAIPAFAEDPIGKVLLLTKSGGFQHGPVTEKDGQPSLVENVLRGVLADQGMQLDATKDASRINADNLANYKLVIFYTQGDLDKDGLDHAPPMGPDGMQALNDWIAKGGGFMGFHSATDTSRPVKADDPATPYTAMIGGAFKSHGAQFTGAVRVIDPKHPAIASVPDGFTIKDEWYVFTHLDTKNMHVLAMLDPGDERAKQEQYNIPNYPVVWCKAQGDGRIFYSAMGHREDVWENPTFLKMTADAIQWATGGSELNTSPNYDSVIKKHAN